MISIVFKVNPNQKDKVFFNQSSLINPALSDILPSEKSIKKILNIILIKKSLYRR